MIPDWFNRLVSRSKGRDLDAYRLIDSLFNQSQAVRHDKFDSTKYDDINEQALELQNISNERFEEDPSWPSLIKDTYLALWKASPELLTGPEMLKSHLLNLSVMEKIIDARQYEELRSWTQLDDWASAMGTISLVLKLNEFFDEQKDLRDKQQEIRQQEQDMIDSLEQMQDQVGGDVESFLDDMEQKLADYQQAAEEFEESIAANSSGIKSAAQQGMNEATEEAEQTAGLVQGFGTDAGQWARLNPSERMALANKLHNNKTLLKIAKMIGRMKRLAVGQWSKRVIHGSDEVYDVQLGNDLSRIVPSELIYLADEELEDIFWSKYATHSLLERKLRGTEKTSRGAIIALMDNSGSMHGDREVWAKAVCLSLLEVAKREHRDFYGIHFSSGRDPMKEWFFPKGECELSDVIDYAGFFIGGGTDFETPLSRGVEVLEDQFNSEGSQKGDLVLITDGECQVSDEWLIRYINAKSDLNFRTYGILIGGGHSSMYRSLNSVSDQVWTVKDIATGGDVSDMWSLI